MRTYGTLTIEAPDFDAGHEREILCFEVEPHVAIRLRRVFPDARSRPGGEVRLSGTPAHLVDVDWFLERYPLDVRRNGGDGGRDWIAERAAAQRNLIDETLRVLDGHVAPESVEMALPPRDYQLRAAQATWNTGRLLIGDEVGLGKTVTALTILARPNMLPAVVVVPPHLAAQWERECERFLPSLSVHVARKRDPYEVDADILIVSYYKVYGWSPALAGKARTVIFDEAQEMRRVGSEKYTGCEQVAHNAAFRVGLSATPIYNYGGEFWNVFNVIAPDALGSWGEFIRAWCIDSFDRRKTTLADPKAFGAYLREHGLMVRRTRAQVARELPDLTQVVEYVDSDSSVLRDHQPHALELAKKIMERQGSNFELMRASSELSNMARLATGIAKANYVADFVRMLVEEGGEQVVVFGWHHAVYDAWTELIGDLGLAWHTGRQTPAAKRKHLDRFIAGEAKVLIMSLRSGQGVDGLQAVCHRVVIGELDWSPGVLEQCVGRIYRDGQAEPVIAYYLLAIEGADPVMADVLGLKRVQIAGVRGQFSEEEAPREADPDHVRRLAAEYLRRAR